MKTAADTGFVVTMRTILWKAEWEKRLGRFRAKRIVLQTDLPRVKEYGCSAKPEELYQMQGLSLLILLT